MQFFFFGQNLFHVSYRVHTEIKKEAAIACAASAIRVCALITHPPYFDTFERVQCPTNYELKTVQDCEHKRIAQC